MRLLHSSQLSFAPLPSRLDFPAHSVSLIVKITLQLVEGGVARLVEGMQPFPTGDEPYADDEAGMQEPRYPSDFVPFKPNTDLLLVGHYHAPGGTPVRSGQVTLALGERNFRLQVCGARRAHDGMLPPPSEAAPFVRLPLRWSYALGGPEAAWNPIGVEYSVSDGQPLPQIEHVPEPTRAQHTPAGFGAVPLTWIGRRALAGTFDERWQRERFPWFPSDFDPRFFQSAAPFSQLCEPLRGDEALLLENLHPENPRYRCQLPGLRAIAAVARQTHSEAEPVLEVVPMRLDTLWIDMDAERAVLVYRGHCHTADADFSDLAYAFAATEPLDPPASDERTLAAAAQALADDHALWEIAEKAPPELSELAAPPPPTAALNAQALAAALAHDGPLAQVNLRGCDLRGADLRRRDLTGALLDHADLSGADLSEANLTEASLRFANLDGAKLCAATLTAADLTGSRGYALDATGCKLDQAVLPDCRWQRARLDGASLVDAEASGARFDEATLDRTDLSRLHARGISLAGASGTGTQLTAAMLARASLRDVQLSDATLVDVELADAELVGARFERCDFSQVDLEAARASGSRWLMCQVTGLRAAGADFRSSYWRQPQGEAPIFSNCDLSEVVLEGAQLPAADFSAAKLGRARIEGCDLRGACFAKADLRSSQLQRCDCFEASFEAAQLEYCDGAGTSFFGAELLDAALADFHGTGRDLARTKLAPP